MTEDSANHFHLGLLIEVDKNVSAKNEIERADERVGIAVQVHSGKSHDAM
jgi:hypothetical protein